MEVLADSASNVRVLCVRSAADPAVRRTLADRDLVIGLDEPSVGIAAQLCPDAAPIGAAPRHCASAPSSPVSSPSQWSENAVTARIPSELHETTADKEGNRTLGRLDGKDHIRRGRGRGNRMRTTC